MRLWPLSFLLILSLHGGEAVLQTRHGQILSGTIRMETNRLIVSNSETLTIIPVEATNLLRLTFDRPGRGLVDDVVTSLTPGLPAPWQKVDIGSSLTFEPLWGGGIFRLFASGTNIGGGSADSLQFVYQEAAGNREIIARLLEVATGAPDAAAGLMMRTSLRPEAASIFVGLLGNQSGAIVERRETDGGPSLIKLFPDFTVSSWVRLKREGDEIAIHASRSGRRWRLLERVNLPGGRYYLGLAAAGARHLGGQVRGKSSTRVLAHRATFDQVRTGESLPLTSFLPRARLRSGSTVAGRMISLHEDVITFLGPDYKPALPVSSLASLQFQWLGRRDANRVELGREGVLLTNGEFVEGEFRGLAGDKIRLSSILLGLRGYDIHDQVKAVVLARATPLPAPYEVETWDGSVWRAQDLEIGNNEIRFREAMLGIVRVPIYEIYTIRPAS